jgi:hypothetical protein
MWPDANIGSSTAGRCVGASTHHWSGRSAIGRGSAVGGRAVTSDEDDSRVL